MKRYPRESRIKAAKQAAVGGRRKRCIKGKNCSAACIAAHMTCLVELPWVGQSLAQARRFILNREPGSQPGKTKKNFGWQDVTAKGAPTAAPVPTGTKEKPAAKVPPKGPTPKKQPSAKPATAKPRINIEREKAEFKKQPTDVLQGLLKYRSQLAPERIKAIESELRGRAKAATPKAAAPKTTAPKQPTAKPARPSELARQAGVSGEREAPRIRELKEVDELAKLGAQALNFGLGKLPGRGEPGGDNPDVVIARLRIRAARNQLRNALRDMGPVGNKDFFKDKDDFEVENMLAVGKWTPRQRLRIEKEMRKRLAGSEKAPGLDVNKPVRVDKKLLAQSPSVLQEVLVQRQNSLNPGQRKKIEAELQRRGIQARPKNKENSFFEADNDFDFASAMRAPGTTIGQGAFGKARLLDRGEVVKEGKIGQYEAAVLNKLQGLGITPELRGVEYRRGALPKTVAPGYGGHVQERQGKLALERAPGLPWGKQLNNADIPERKQLIDAYLRVRADLHRQGVAHNDMHGGNVFYDKKTGKAMLIDMGLAQISPKAALIEGLGVFNGRDWQADKYDLRGAKTPTVKKLQENIRQVEAELRRLGVDTDRMPQIRANSTKIQAALGKITDSQAQNLVNRLYDGIGTPPSAPKAKTATAKPASKPATKTPTAKPSKSTLASESSNSQFRKAIKIADDANLKNVAKFRTALNSVQNRELDKELARRGLQAAGAKGPTAKAPTAKPKNKANSFFEHDADYDFHAAMRAPASVKGKGEFGQVRILAENGHAVKDGKIGQYEAAVLEKLEGKGIAPKLLGVEYKSGALPKTVESGYGGHVQERQGFLAMGGAPGVPWVKQLYKADAAERKELIDAYLTIRARLHKEGIAHNDMHGYNVFYDKKTGKAVLIDMGLAQISPKAALIEALGVFNGKDFQAERFYFAREDTPIVNKLKSNVARVKKDLKGAGVDVAALPEIRASRSKIEKALGKITDSEAQSLVNRIYEGIGSAKGPTAKVPTAKGPAAKAPTPKPTSAAPKAKSAVKPTAAKPAARPEGVRTKREKMDLDEFKKDIKNEKTEELADILFARGHGANAGAQAKANKQHRAALGKDKVDEIEREVRRRMGKPSERTPLVISAGQSGAAPKTPTAKPASANPASGKPKLDTAKMRSNLKKQDDRVLAEVLRQPNLASAQRNLIREEVQRRDLANKVRNDKTAVLERLDRLGEARLGKVKAEVVKAELQRRKANPQPEPPASAANAATKKERKISVSDSDDAKKFLDKAKAAGFTKKEIGAALVAVGDKVNKRPQDFGIDEIRKVGSHLNARGIKPEANSFLEAKKPYDFSAADRKPGWVDVGGGAQGEVRLNNNLSQPAAMKNGKVGQYEAAALERLQNVSNVPNLYGVRYDSKQGPQRMDSGLGGSLGPHIRERPGKLAMELKEGKPLYRVMGRNNKDQLTDDLVKARKAIHMRGVAHNDMHGGNVLYDDANKKLNVIDFGLAQISPKAALIEALGGWNARDFQAASMMYRGNGPAVKRYMQNVNNVEAKLKARGLDPDKIPGIRTPMADIDKYFGSMTDSEAQRLIADVYDGI